MMTTSYSSKTVANLWAEMRLHKDRTMAPLIQEAIGLLKQREAVYDHTELGDNVIDLIIAELRNALGTGGAATAFAVANMFAVGDAQVGSADPLLAAQAFLARLKTGATAEVAREPLGPVLAETGTVFGVACPVVCIGYATDQFTVCGGITGILSVNRTFPAGVLIVADADDGMNFQMVGEDTLKDWRSNGKELSDDAARETAKRVLTAALAMLESGQPEFAFKAHGCSPVPNFMKSENWPTIVELIRDWLSVNAPAAT